MSCDLSGRRAAVLGGDGREVEIVRALVQAGAVVRTCGLPPAGAAVAGTPAAATVAEAVAAAQIIICPIPLPQADGSIFAPQAGAKLIIDTESLGGAAPGALLITGKAGPQMRAAAAALGLGLHEYEHEEDLMLLRAPAIAEGAIRAAIANTEVTLHGNPCLVVGFGKIAPTLAQMLRGLGARVTVAARNPVQLARATAIGCETVPIIRLAEVAPQMAAIFNTAPALLFDRPLLEGLGPENVIIDLSGPPGAVDWEAARSLGRKAVWARGLGGRASVTVGQSQWFGIRRILDAELGG